MPELDDGRRRFPLVEVPVGGVSALLSPLLKGAVRIEQVEGGLTNTILRIFPDDGGRSLLVRIFPDGRARWEREQNILTRLRGLAPVPDLLLAEDGGGALPYPSLVYPWIEGLTLNSFRTQVPASELLKLAEPLGRLLARVSSVTCGIGVLLGAERHAPFSSVESLLFVSQQRLLAGRARMRLGGVLADEVWRLLARDAERFPPLGSMDCLVHGDLGGRNILVAPDAGDEWRIAALLDWEDAFSGWALWDVGSLFRYPRRYGAAFRDQFEQGYRAAAGALPEGWWTTARLLDASRQVATLDDERERPAAFADCRELLAQVIEDDR